MSYKAPRIETEHLVLRSMSMDDWPDYVIMLSSSRAKHMGGPFDTADAWSLFCRDIAQWSLFGLGSLMIDEKSTGLCVGQVGINSGPLFPEYELGWMLYEAVEGKGIAYEAAMTTRDWAFNVRGLETLVSYISPANELSIKLAQRLGAVLDHGALRPDSDDLVFRHPVA